MVQMYAMAVPSAPVPGLQQLLLESDYTAARLSEQVDDDSAANDLAGTSAGGFQPG